MAKKIMIKFFLDEKETSHLKVVRKIPGEEINVITGDGFVYTAIIDSIKKKKKQFCLLKIRHL